jgi:hypothetical protein
LFQTAFLFQKPDDLHAAVAQCELQWRQSADVCGVHVCSLGNQQFHHLQMPCPGSFVQRGGASVTDIDGIRRRFEKHPDLFRISLTGSLL